MRRILYSYSCLVLLSFSLCFSIINVSAKSITSNDNKAKRPLYNTELQKKANDGDYIAQEQLGECYYYGSGIRQDLKTAVKWFLKSAKQDYDVAQYYMGKCYENGHGVDRNDCKALEWYKKAAEKKNADAEYAIALFYRFGLCVSRDQDKYMEWLRMAAEHGSADALYELGLRYEIGDGVPKDKKIADDMIKRAAEQGHEKAQMLYESNHPHKHYNDKTQDQPSDNDVPSQNGGGQNGSTPTTDSNNPTNQDETDEAITDTPKHQEQKQYVTISNYNTQNKPYRIDYSYPWDYFWIKKESNTHLWEPAYRPAIYPRYVNVEHFLSPLSHVICKYALFLWISSEFHDSDSNVKYTKRFNEEFEKEYKLLSKQTKIPTWTEPGLKLGIKDNFQVSGLKRGGMPHHSSYTSFATLEFSAKLDRPIDKGTSTSLYAIFMAKTNQVVCSTPIIYNIIDRVTLLATVTLDVGSIETLSNLTQVIIVDKKSDLWALAQKVEAEQRELCKQELEKKCERIRTHQKNINVNRSIGAGIIPLP